MVKEIIAEEETTTKDFDISTYTKVTVYLRGGTGSWTIELGKDKDTLVSHSTPATDTINEITEDAMVIKITINTGPTGYDIVGELR